MFLGYRERKSAGKSLYPLQFSGVDQANLRTAYGGLLMKSLDQRIKWEMPSTASASVEGTMPSFHVIILSNWLALYAPGSCWNGVAVYPLSV